MGTTQLTVKLQAGRNTIRLSNSSSWMPDIDYIELLPVGSGATDAEKAALSAAITSAKDKTPGFDVGDYAPYNNMDAFQALANAKTINMNTASSADITAATNALVNATWTQNTQEMNAIAGGYDLNSYTHVGKYDLPNGWSNTGYSTRIVGINESPVSANPGLAGAVNSRAILVKQGTAYGEKPNYTLPLKAETRYAFSFTYGLWNENVTVKKLFTVTAPDGSNVEVTPGSVSKKENNKGQCANILTTAWYNDTVRFTTTLAGDYILNIVNADGNNQRQMCFSGMTLKKEEGLETGIRSIHKQQMANPNYYDLIGRQVTPARCRKGIYIVKGKKIVCK